MTSDFEGKSYLTADNWHPVLPVADYQRRPIQYLEIGVFYGANLISVARTYAAHPDSKLYAIDPWCDYENYHEYVGELDRIYQAFLRNLDKSGQRSKVLVRRAHAHQILPYLPNDFFDLIYIDGNHQKEHVLEDAVLAFRKLKPTGILIFDDYIWPYSDDVSQTVMAFINCYQSKLTVLGPHNNQMFIRKNSSM